MTVGRPHATFWKDAAAHYMERLSRWRRMTETIIRDSDPALPVARRVEEEGKRILAALTPQLLAISFTPAIASLDIVLKALSNTLVKFSKLLTIR